MSPVRILLVGFGRMGISHLSIMSGLLQPKLIEIHIVDNSLASRMIAKELVTDAKVYKSLEDVAKIFSDGYFDFCLITTPPIKRAELVSYASQLAKVVFIEKPLMISVGANHMSGYVLQHAPLNAKVFEYLAGQKISSINARLTTNISFDGIEKGWRSSKFGTVLYEFGGHLLTLVGSTCGMDSFLNTNFKLSDVSVSKLEKNHANLAFSSGGSSISLELRAGSHEVRKACYEIEFITANGIFTYDLYSFNLKTINDYGDDDVLFNIAAIDTTVDFYVRGFEFTLQMQALINGNLDVLTTAQIENIEKIIDGSK
ncbi:Gfo/Idh/MocA family oxidoreductase [Pseudomonadales bacterium]|nr:Gfo/Idh/MocA family oxidoreductase [Pseudomonadales bacterium]